MKLYNGQQLPLPNFNSLKTIIMKKVIMLIALFAGLNAAQAQAFKFGIKAGVNFANFSGGIDEIDYSGRTSFHAGLAAELGIGPKFAIGPELLYTSQGADVDGVGDFNLDYVSVPVLAKIYIVPDTFSLDIGPQFSFLVDEAEEAFENESFDFAVAGGATLNITKSFYAQARYVWGLTEASKEAEVKNTVLQLSLGYNFL